MKESFKQVAIHRKDEAHWIASAVQVSYAVGDQYYLDTVIEEHIRLQTHLIKM
jgi:hypothetical protein